MLLSRALLQVRCSLITYLVSCEITNRSAKPSLTQQRAADAQKRKEERDAFFVWVFNGLCQTDKNFEPFEDAARAKFGETLNSLLERMQLWLKRTKKAQPAYWLGRRGGRHRG